jgi:RimJ/RimL family protein N-acetyltransferase
MTSLEPVELRDGDLLLRPWSPSDVDAVYEECPDPELQHWTGHVPSPYTRADAETFVSGSPAKWAAGTPSFAMVDASNGTLVGAIGVGRISPDGDPEIGYWVAASRRREGLARRGTQLLASWLFEQGHVRITWHCRVGNVASRRAAEAAGFVIEGTARQGALYRGERDDIWVASLLPADLERAREEGNGPGQPDNLLTGWPLSPVELRSERLLLRASRESDAEALLAYARDPLAAKWDPEDTPDLESAKALARTRADWSGGDVAVWVIADPDDATVFGGVQMSDIRRRSLHAMVGYGLMPDARGQGFAAEALRTVTEWAFSATNLVRLSLLHATENSASCAVATKAGFALEGTTHLSYRYGDGELHDEHLHARLRSDDHL